jgi:ketosteroid isomerase-like protein
MVDRMPGELARLIRQVFEAGEAMDVHRFAQRFTEDALYQFGNEPPARGREGIIEARSIAAFNQTVKSIVHHVKGMWEIGDLLIVEMQVTYVRHDGKQFTLPACDTVRFKGDLVEEMRIYMDISPVFVGT